MRQSSLSLFLSLLTAGALAAPVAAQNPLELLIQQQPHYWFSVASVSGPAPVPDLEGADDFDLVADIRRVRALGKTCSNCVDADLLSARLRIYEWTSSGPGTLQYELVLQDGDPALQTSPGPGTIDFTLNPPFQATGKHFLSVQLEVAGFWSWKASNYGQPVGSTVYSRADDASAWSLHEIIYPAGPAFSDLAFEIYGDDGTPPTAGTDPCGPWEVVASPVPTDGQSPFLRNAKAFASDDVWAVGSYSKLTAPPSSYDTFSWIQRWDGSTWNFVPSPNPEPYPGGGYIALDAVDGVAPDDVWAAGTFRTQAPDGFLGFQVFVVHWDGTSWTQVAAPMTSGGSGQYVHDILAIAPDDVWFFGGRIDSSTINARQALALHWDGTGFTYHDVPFDASTMTLGYGDGHSINSASALASDDIWAVGQAHGADFSPISNIWHWDGTSWEFEQGPTPGIFNALFAVAAIAPDDVWAAGAYTPSGGGARVAFYLHWDGTSWSEVAGPGGGSTLVVRAPDDILSSAGIYGGQGIFRWDGTAWSKVMNFDTTANPLIVGLELVDGCEVWGVGRQNGVDVGALTVHLDAGPNSASSTLISPCGTFAPEDSLVTSPLPTLGTNVSFAANDPDGSLGLTPGSLAFLALSGQAVGSGGCGLPVIGLGLGNQPGELFLQPIAPPLTTAPWLSPDQPAVFNVQVPTSANLVGLTVFAQALFVNAADGDQILTEALELTVGP